jgi:perosamine synthetase
MGRLLQGNKRTMENISLFYPNIYKKEWLAELEKVFSTRWIGQGPLVEEFERQFAEKFGFKYCLSVNSGTSALELAYDLIGIGEGDIVLSSVFTCTATNIPLLRRGAFIRFLDIGDNLTASYDDVVRKISKDVKAIVVVTVGGIPIDNRIFALAKENNIPVVIDAAQSLGILEPNGDYVCYSFQAIKHFTTGDGGMLVTRNEDDYKRAKKLRWFGIDREAKRQADWRCMINRQMTMDIDEPGYKYHMNDISAAMGIVGLRHSNETLMYRGLICDKYMKELGGGICGGSYWLFAVLVHDRDNVIKYLRDNGIECDLVQLRNDIFKVFNGRQRLLENMDRLESHYLYLPLHQNLRNSDIGYVTETLKKCYIPLK